MKKSMFTRVCANLLIGVGVVFSAAVFAVEPKEFVIDATNFVVNVRGEDATFKVKRSIVKSAAGDVLELEFPWAKGKSVQVKVRFTQDKAGLDMLNEYPTIDYTVTQTQKGKPWAVYANVYCDGYSNWMQEKGIGVETNLTSVYVSRVNRELGHTPSWSSWIDVRAMKELTINYAADTWEDQKAVQKITISAFRFTDEDSWKGTDRDRWYRAWLEFADSYEPDFSDSSKYLEPPVEGRLERPLELVKGGVAKGEIVVYPDTYRSIDLAARELQYWVKEMTGAELPIVTNEATKSAAVRVHLNSPEAMKKYAADVDWLKAGKDVDGYFVHTEGNDIYIGCAVGSDVTAENAEARGLPRDACAVGVFRGVVAMLENNSTIIFACNDSKYGTVYDQSPDFVVRWGEGRDRPATCGRGWLRGTEYDNVRDIGILSHDMWRARNKTNVRLPHRLSGHGAMSGEEIEFFPNTDAYRAWDGKRRVPFGYYNAQVCLSAPDALDWAISNAVRKIELCKRLNYPVTSIGFWNEDNWLVCVCDKCTAPIKLEDGRVLTSNKQTSKGGMANGEKEYRSTQYMLFVNKLADAVAAKYPGVKTEILAYFFQFPAPLCKVSPNVAWIYAPYHQRASYMVPLYHPLGNWAYRNMEAFLAAGGEMRLYDYHAFAYIGVTHQTVMAEAAAEDFRYLTGKGAKLLGSEMCYLDKVDPVAAMFGWLYTQVAWHADLKEVSDLRKYFIRRVFREGAPAVEKYVLTTLRNTLRAKRPGEEDVPKGDKAKALFEPYLDKITNPTAKMYYKLMMEKAIKGQ